MNFFDAQDQARRATKWLVAGYLLATLLIVCGVVAVVAFALAGFGTSTAGNTDVLGQHGALLAATAAAATLFIVGASLYKTAALSGGGSKVAVGAGGTPVPADASDPDRRRLRNVVEEIAIASGIPVPDIFVLEAESGINAFAAGYAPGDAAIAVTRGALELLDRDELQGVIAHEFSHILNGDMRLNIRLMGILFGIMVLGLIGRVIVRGGYHGSLVSTRRSRNAAAILLVGAGLTILGAVGVFFARVIKASVSRQREVLADASAVQFTRQTRGLANALKKIGGYEQHSWLQATDPEEISHMLFGSGANLGGIFATHPPLLDRIRALDPAFQAADYPRVYRGGRVDTGNEDAGRGQAPALHDGAVAARAPAIVASIGKPESRHIRYAEWLRQSIPEALYRAAHSPDLAYLLALALVIDTAGLHRQRQLALLDERLGPARRRLIESFVANLADAGLRYRLPLLEVAFPVLKRRPRESLEFLLDLARRLIEIDRHTSLYEYCVYRILCANLDQATDPGHRPRHRAPAKAQRRAMLDLVRMVADHGQRDREARDRAFALGALVLGEGAEELRPETERDGAVATLDRSLDSLLALEMSARRRLVEAVSETAAHDGRLQVAEAELIRVVCAVLDCPLPPILETPPAE